MNLLFPAFVIAVIVVVGLSLAPAPIPPAPPTPPTAGELTPETCAAGGGSWTECGSPCAGTDSEVCIQVCEQQCQCGGFAGWTCPECSQCRLTGKIADELGKCIPAQK